MEVDARWFRSGRQCRVQRHALAWRRCLAAARETARSRWRPEVALFSVPSSFPSSRGPRPALNRSHRDPTSKLTDRTIDIGDCLEYNFAQKRLLCRIQRNSSRFAGTVEATGRAQARPSRPLPRITSGFNGRVFQRENSRTSRTLDINDLSHDCYLLLHPNKRKKRGIQRRFPAQESLFDRSSKGLELSQEGLGACPDAGRRGHRTWHFIPDPEMASRNNPANGPGSCGLGQISVNLGTRPPPNHCDHRGNLRAWGRRKKPPGYSNCFMMPSRHVDEPIVVAKLEPALTENQRINCKPLSHLAEDMTHLLRRQKLGLL